MYKSGRSVRCTISSLRLRLVSNSPLTSRLLPCCLWLGKCLCHCRCIDHWCHYRDRDIQLSVLVRADGERRCRRWWVQLTQLRPTRILKLTHQGTAPERSLYPQLLCCYSAPGGGGGVLWWACLSVCLCVCLSAIISPELQTRSSPSFLCMLPMTVVRSSSSGVAICQLPPVLRMTS